MYVSNPWINPNTIEHRAYQDAIVKEAVSKNLLCVIPTGLGKTSIAALVTANRLEKYPDSKILFLAPTRPLVEQHRKTFERVLKLGLELKVVTGEDAPETRTELYKKADIVFSTPQCARNDLKKDKISLKDFALCIFDEAHRCTGEYAYTYIAKCYMNGARHPLILALTASPGSFKTKIDEVRQKLFIEGVEIRNREDEDVKPYVQSVREEWVEVELPEEMKSIKKYLEDLKLSRIKKLFDWKIISSYRITKTQLLRLQQELARRKTGSGYMAMSIIAEILKTDHALLLLETQSLYSLKRYFNDMDFDETRAVARLQKDEKFLHAVRLTNELVKEGREHPKVGKLLEIVRSELNHKKDARLIIFAQYRSTISKICETLKSVNGAAPVEFIGQAKKHGKGLSQKEQVQIVNEFKLGFYNILCASQVAEEGLDIAETDIVIFYEPVPSAVRKIQRTGRTARTRVGKVITLMAKDTRDEAFHWVSRVKENRMKKILHDIKHKSEQRQKSLQDFKEKSSDYIEDKTEDYPG